MSSKVVVITGCLGFIGQWVTKACLDRGWYVYGVDKKTYAADNEPCFPLDDEKFNLLEEDICTLSKLPDCDCVINLAAESHVGNSIVDSGDFIRTNVEGVRNLLELVRAKPINYYGKPLFIHFSTDEVYGDLEEGSFTEENSLNPSNPYSASKAAGDMLIRAWARTYDMDYVIVRPTNNYGIGQYPEKLIPITVKILQADRRKIPLHNAGEPYRSWLHVEDTASAVMKIVDEHVGTHKVVQKKINEIYNIGGTEQQNREVVRKIVNSFKGWAVDHEWTDLDYHDYTDSSFSRLGQDVRYSVDDSKLKKLGWLPKKDFDRELPDIVENCKKRFRW